MAIICWKSTNFEFLFPLQLDCHLPVRLLIELNTVEHTLYSLFLLVLYWFSSDDDVRLTVCLFTWLGICTDNMLRTWMRQRSTAMVISSSSCLDPVCGSQRRPSSSWRCWWKSATLLMKSSVS